MKKGKIPPQAIDVEEIVLGAMLIDKKGVDEVMELLRPKVFYDMKHQEMFRAISKLYMNGQAIDLITVTNQLKEDRKLEDVGGEVYIIELTQKISSSAHIEFHCRIILQKFIQRELIRNAGSIIENSYQEGFDVFDLLDKAYSHLNQVSDLIISNNEIDIDKLTEEIVDHGAKLYRNEIEPGLQTPIKNLTDKMGGWRDSELIIIAARPGMGKTAFALKAGWILAKQNIPVGFFSLEMSAKRLLSRVWSMECNIENDKFTKTGISPEEESAIMQRKQELGTIPFHVDDSDGNLTIQSLTVKAKKWKKEKDIKILIVDYLQLMRGNKKNREQEITEISRGLKLLAGELDLPIIALSQLSRAVEQRGGNKRPLLSDLRESGAIEQDADVVQFIYRPEYYGLTEWDDYQSQTCQNQAEYIIAKNRNGSLVRNRMKFIGEYTNFIDLDDDQYDEEDFIIDGQFSSNVEDDSPF